MEEDGEVGVPPLIYITAGCIAGAIEAIATWPTEYIKTKLQLQKQHIVKYSKSTEQLDGAAPRAVDYIPPASAFRTTESSSSGTSLNEDYERAESSNCQDTCVLEIVKSMEDVIYDDDPPLMLLPYTDMISGMLYTVKTLGFFALYYGLTPTLLGSIPKAGIRFGMFAWFSHLLQDEDTGVTSTGMTFVAGCMAGVVEALIVVVPVETIKTKCIQMDLPFWEGLKQILLLEGIGGVYTGGLATVIKQSSNHGLRFVWYSEYKRIATNNGEYALTPIMALFGGMTAGIFSALGNQPADVIKTKMQGVCAGYTSTWDCIKKTYTEGDGISGFYTGIVPRLARVVPGQGILFLSYEVIVSVLMSLYV